MRERERESERESERQTDREKKEILKPIVWKYLFAILQQLLVFLQSILCRFDFVIWNHL